jgi:hypothetical protein
LEEADMDIVIGPVLRYADGYRFDTWTTGEGQVAAIFIAGSKTILQRLTRPEMTARPDSVV